MTISQIAILSDDVERDVIALTTRVYFQERLRNRLYNLVVRKFRARQSVEPSFTQQRLALILNKRPAQVSRWLSSPSNWTIDTVSDLLIGIDGTELELNTIQPTRKNTSESISSKSNPSKIIHFALETTNYTSDQTYTLLSLPIPQGITMSFDTDKKAGNYGT